MANPVDELVIAITAETDDAVKGIKDVDKALDDTQKKADKTKKESKQVSESWALMIMRGAGVTAVLTGIATAFTGLSASVASFFSFIRDANQLELLTMKTGVSARELDAWSKAAEAAGGSSQALQQSLASFYAKTGREATEFFKLADKIEGMSEGQKRRYLQAMGVNLDAVPLFMRGKDEVARLVARYRRDALNSEDIRKARQFSMELHDFQDSVKGIGREIGRAVLPYMRSFVGVLRNCANWVRENSRLIKTFAVMVSTALTAYMIPSLVKLAIAFAPLTAMVAVIAALAVAIEDLYVFAKGGDSWIGKMLGGKNPELAKELKENIDAVVDAFSSLWNAISNSETSQTALSWLIKGFAFVAKVIAGLLAVIIMAIDDTAHAIGAIVDWFFDIGRAIGSAIDWVADFFSSLFSFNTALAIIRAVSSAIDAVGEAIRAVIAPAKELWNTLSNSAIGKFFGKLFTPYGTENRNAEGVSAEQARYQNNSSSVNTNANVTVNNNFPTTPSNPRAYAQEVGRTMVGAGRQTAKMVGNSYSGVNLVGG